MPLQPMEVQGGTETSYIPWKTHAGAGGCPKDAMTLWEAHTESGSWTDGKRSPQSSWFDELWEETQTAEFSDELQPLGETPIVEAGVGLSPMGGTPQWSRGRM